MIAAIYRNTLEGFKLCVGECFEYAGFKFCITVVEDGEEILVYAIEYSTGYNVIPFNNPIYFKPLKDSLHEKIKEAKAVIRKRSKKDYEDKIDEITDSIFLKGVYPLNMV